MTVFSTPQDTNWTSRFVDAGGIRTHYLEAGQGEPLVLIHGGGSGADAYGNWQDCIPRLSGHFRVLAVEMVGFGKTDKPNPESYEYTQENRAKHILAFLDALNLSGVYVVGNSMGGAAALAAAMMRPTVFKKIVLMGSAGLRGDDQGATPLPALVDYDFTIEGMRRLVETITGPNFEITDERIKYRHALSVEPESRAALTAINAIAKKGGLIFTDDQVRSVKVPTLVMNGKVDKVATMGRGLKFLELLENSWGYFVPHVGHWVMIEAPEDFCNATTNFFLNTRNP